MNRAEILRRVGSMQQLAYARRVEYGEGRANGLGAVEVKNGPLRFTAMADKALDVCELEYKGEILNFLAKTGLGGRSPFDTHGAEAQRSIMGGLFFTCGLENICAPYTGADGKEYPMHGRMRTTPAEHVCADARWSGDDYLLRVSGELREAELFGENLVLRRSITSRFGEAALTVGDEIVNEGFRDEPVMLMYHCNVGYPFLSEDCRLILPSRSVTPRDEISAAQTGRWDVMDPPRDGAEEFVFVHELAADTAGDTFAAVADDKKGRALVLEWNRANLPYFMEWKSTASGDYVLGLEPSNSLVYGRAYHERRGTLHTLAPGASQSTALTFRVVEGADEIAALDARRDLLLHS